MKRRIIVRLFPFNRLTFPLLLNVWESHGLDREFEIVPTGADTRAGASRAEPLRRRVGAFRPGDVLLYSFMTPHLEQIAAEVQPIVAERRARPPGDRYPLLAAGGPHVTGDAELPARLGFDVLFRGPGERSFRRFGEELLGGTFDRAREAPHLYDDRQAPPVPWTDYLPLSRYSRTYPPLEIMRGCRWRCRYCQTGGGRPQFRPPGSIARWFAEMRRRDVGRVNFISPSSLEFGAEPGGTGVAGLLQAARDAGFRFVEYGIFPSEVRPGSLGGAAARMLRQAVSNRRLTIGAQSGVGERLHDIRRGHGTDDVEQTVATAHEAGFRANLDFIFALPGEGEAETEASVAFIRGLHRRWRVNIHVHHFFPLAGSAYARHWPARLNARQRQALLELRRQGIGNDWWLQGEAQAAGFRSWLEKRFADVAESYTD